MSKKVLFIGIDGMDPVIAESLMESGQLPNFSRMRKEGRYEQLATINPSQSPVVWASIATGANPGTHGVFDFIHRNPKDYRPYLSLLQFDTYKYVPPVKSKTFWELAGEKGTPSVVLKWPVTFPPRKTNGRILSGLGVPDIKGMMGLYTLFTSDADTASPEKKGRFVKIAKNGSRVITEIPGPHIASLTGKREAKTQLDIQIRDGAVNCSVGGSAFALREKEWSNWIPIAFDTGLMRSVKAWSRFYLKSIAPVFSLYMTPLNVPHDSREFPCSEPREYAKELQDSIGSYATLGMAEDTNALNEDSLDEDAFLSFCDSLMDERERMFLYEYERFKQGILACVFDTTDRIQHMFWRTIDSSHPRYEEPLAARYRNVIGDYYRRMDRIVGHVLNSLPSDALLIVCSDHGFSSFKKSVHLNTWLVNNGFMTLKKGKSACEGLYDNVDWTNTQAYAVGFTSLYLNVKGREGSGIITGNMLPRVKDDLIRRLQSFTDNGTRVVNAVYDTSKIYQGKQLANAPDLIIGYGEECRGSWQTAIGGAPEGQLVETNVKKWSGDHCCDASSVPGVFFCNEKDACRDFHVERIASVIGRKLEFEM